MIWLWIILGLSAIIIASSAAKRKQEQRYELQFWEKHERPNDECWMSMGIHFPTMLLRYKFDCIGGPNSLRLKHVKRNSDGSWDMRYTDRSWLIEYNDQQHNLASLSSGIRDMFESDIKERLKKMEQEGNIWVTMDPYFFDGSLETAYQRFIHTPDIPIASLTWLDEEEKEEKQLAVKLEQLAQS